MSHHRTLPTHIKAMFPDGVEKSLDSHLRDLEKAMATFGIGVEGFFLKYGSSIPETSQAQITHYIQMVGRKAFRDEIQRIRNRLDLLARRQHFTPIQPVPKRSLGLKSITVQEAVQRIHSTPIHYQRGVIEFLAVTPEASSSLLRENIDLPPETSHDYKHVTDAFRRWIIEPLIKIGIINLVMEGKRPRNATYQLTPLGIREGLKLLEDKALLGTKEGPSKAPSKIRQAKKNPKKPAAAKRTSRESAETHATPEDAPLVPNRRGRPRKLPKLGDVPVTHKKSKARAKKKGLVG